MITIITTLKAENKNVIDMTASNNLFFRRFKQQNFEKKLNVYFILTSFNILKAQIDK